VTGGLAIDKHDHLRSERRGGCKEERERVRERKRKREREREREREKGKKLQLV